ncbi:hypothetical protein MtrunA17_Chr4g0041501 [Medicago truncatula]|uniref:Uncharacterized protein n=1 Tax=Medicago truncatula TaxID=3880 RepID=A0A396I8F3_MEDTR|nr:hypothetical protein MtrunA17_Chr4g0041501 [Medicago truncatula]
MNSLNHRLIYRFTPYLDHNLHEAWKQHEEVFHISFMIDTEVKHVYFTSVLLPTDVKSIIFFLKKAPFFKECLPDQLETSFLLY